MYMVMSGTTPKSLEGRELIVSNQNGNTSIPFRVKRLTGGPGWMGLMYTGDTFTWGFNYSEQLTNITYDATTGFITSGDYYYVRHQLMQSYDGFNTTDTKNVSLTALPNSATARHGDYYWDSAAKTMTYIVTSPLVKRKRRAVIFDTRDKGVDRQIKFWAYRCYYPNCVATTMSPLPSGIPEVTYKWSNIETWKQVPVGTGGHPSDTVYYLPTEGQSITVPVGMKLVVDVATPPLGHVTVYGTLEFEDTRDHVFEASIIYIQGGRVIAGQSESAPFTHNLNITLRGSTDASNTDNEEKIMPDGVPTVGWKAIGVFGELNLFGQGTGDAWIKLASTAAAGSTQITLTKTPDSFWVNKEVVVTTTGRDVSETEIRTVVSVSGNVITLNASLQYEHLGVTHTLGDGTTYTLAAEVGLLGRNIFIEGSATTKSFGGRILVSQVIVGDVTYRGSARLVNVEFRRMGQDGFIDGYDPRFSIVFHGLGNDSGQNYVKRCGFNKNYNTAVGLFNSNNITVENNVVYHTVGPGIRDESSSNAFRKNLVTLMLFPGTYDGRSESQNHNFYGAFSLNIASGTILDGNVVAGSEQGGYQTQGEFCQNISTWINNEVHNSLYGVLLWKTGWYGKPEECRRVNKFYAWRIWDTAFYMQHYTSLLLTNVTSVESRIGANQLVFGPTALSHTFYDKNATIQDSVFIGASPSYTCTFHEAKSNIENFFKEVLWGSKGADGGNSGIIFGSFISMTNMAPTHAFHSPDRYPAIHGGTFIKNVKFAGFNNRTCGRDIALITNKDGDDAIHPIFVKELKFVDTHQDNYLFMHIPNLDRVNPSDCVDMTCDGLKKVIVQDMDGTLLGSINATATAFAEYEWDGDRSHGVGDYRIPASLKQNKDGTQIPAAQKFPNKGVIRDSTCSINYVWRAWKCIDLKHRMMVIESMDPDTEIRRLSPIAIIANPGTSGYVDLLNGPMDRGWCKGYTCQERISTFYSIVAAGQIYEMSMTSSPPQVIRFHLLHSDPSESLVLKMFFPKTQRFDVYVDDQFVPPTNINRTVYPGKYELVAGNNSTFIPTLNDAVGTNYLARDDKFLHVVLRGGHIIDIKTMPTVVLNMGLVVDPDNFYEENIVENLSKMLGINKANIRITNIIRENSGRKKRGATVTYQFQFEISSPPTATANASVSQAVVGSTAQVLNYNDLLNVMVNVVNTFQGKTCQNCNLTIAKLEVIEPMAPPVVAGPPATEALGSNVTNGSLFSDIQQALNNAALEVSLKAVTYLVPSGSNLSTDVPATVVTYTQFSPQPVYNVLSQNGSILESLGFIDSPWIITASLSRGPPSATLHGTTSVPYVNGGAKFTDLFVTNPGEGYQLIFNIDYPQNVSKLPAQSQIFRSVEKKVSLIITQAPSSIMEQEIFSLTMQLQDGDTKQPLSPNVLKGQLLTGTVSMSTGGGVNLMGNTSFTVNGSSISTFVVKGLYITGSAAIYTLGISASVQPAGWNLQATEVIYNSLSTTTASPQNETVTVTMIANQLGNFTDNGEEFGGLLKDALKKQIGTKVTWIVKISLMKMKPYAEVQLIGKESDLVKALKLLCAAVDYKRIYVTYNNLSYTMGNLNLFIRGKHRLCPGASNTNIIIRIHQKVG